MSGLQFIEAFLELIEYKMTIEVTEGGLSFKEAKEKCMPYITLVEDMTGVPWPGKEGEL